MRILLGGTGALIALPAVLFVAVMLWPDAALDPAAQRVLAAEYPAVVAYDNRFNALMGLHAPLDEPDFVAYGEQRVREINRRLAEHDRSANPSASIDFGDIWPAVDWDRAALQQLCNADERPCAPYWREQRTAIDSLAARFRTRLQRLTRLHALPGYAMTLTPDHRAPLPRFVDLLALYNLRLNVLGAACVEAAPGALEAFAGEIAFARRAMRETRQLLGKIVAVEQLRRSVYAYAQCVDLWRADANAPRSLARLSPAEISLREPYMTLFRETVRLLTHLSIDTQQPLPDRALRPLIKPHRSTNLAFGTYATLAAISELPPGRLGEAPRLLSGLRAPWHEYMINPVGAILHEVGAPSKTRYAYRVHDADGLISLFNAKLALREGAVPADRIPATLSASRWRDPYHQAPLQWDGDQRALFFASPDPDSKANRLRHAP